MPPHTEITTFSISNCRTKRQRLAPSAARTAISLSREMLRASARFARLAQPISNTNSSGGEQDRDGGAQPRADQHVGETVDGNAPALVRVGIGVGKTPPDDVHLGPRFLERHARLELGARAEPAKITRHV